MFALLAHRYGIVLERMDQPQEALEAAHTAYALGLGQRGANTH
jgi:hypothetical protein